MFGLRGLLSLFSLCTFYSAMASTARQQRSALFVCLGNICRSPIGERVFRHLVTEKGVADEWVIDSAGTASWHVGKLPDSRGRECMKNHGLPMDHHARQVHREDFNKFQYILAMDESNFSDLQEMAPDSHTAKVELLGSYDPQKKLNVRDPYYDNDLKGFEEVYEHCLRSCKVFLDKIYK